MRWRIRRREPGLKDEIMALYLKLDAYPEAVEALEAVKARGKLTAILSNGSPSMLDSAVRHAGLDKLFNMVLSVEDVGIYKPTPPRLPPRHAEAADPRGAGDLLRLGQHLGRTRRRAIRLPVGAGRPLRVEG